MDKATMIALMAASLYQRPGNVTTFRQAAEEAVDRANEIWEAALSNEEKS